MKIKILLRIPYIHGIPGKFYFGEQQEQEQQQEQQQHEQQFRPLELELELEGKLKRVNNKHYVIVCLCISYLI